MDGDNQVICLEHFGIVIRFINTTNNLFVLQKLDGFKTYLYREEWLKKIVDS